MMNKGLQILKWGSLILLVIGLILSLTYWDLVTYGFRQARGQLHIIWNAKPVEEFLNDPDFPDSLKSQLQLIEEVRQFAIDSLGLKDTKNYRTLYDQEGKELMWVVTASERFELKPKEWDFPLIGSVPYKGFFDKEMAMHEKKKLEACGMDVWIINPGGWSTLGWFSDPILSGMLSRNKGDLAGLIIHEMVHATIFVKDSVDFNENLASFIGDRGAEKFLISRFGQESAEYKRYMQEEKEFKSYVDHILRGCDYLDSVYSAIVNESVDSKSVFKEKAIYKIIKSADSISMEVLQNPTLKRLSSLPNNAYFLSYRRYQSKQEIFWSELQDEFSGNLQSYIADLTKRYRYL